jgi:hypothetical protein
VTWVVLDHSKIYEYGGIDTNQYDCQAVIDLRFASVREGRDTDRRFGESSPITLNGAQGPADHIVFEVISAKSGRRLYQATSEVDLKVCPLIKPSYSFKRRYAYIPDVVVRDRKCHRVMYQRDQLRPYIRRFQTPYVLGRIRRSRPPSTSTS